MTQVVRIVDRVGSSDWLYDLSPGTGPIEVGPLDEAFPPPKIDRSVSSNPTADGGSIPSSLYGLREVKLPLRLTGGWVDDALVGTQARKNAVYNPELTANTTGYSAPAGTSGTNTGTRQTGTDGPWVDGRRLPYYRGTWSAVTSGALANTGLQYGFSGSKHFDLAPGTYRYSAVVRSSVARTYDLKVITLTSGGGTVVPQTTIATVALAANVWTRVSGVLTSGATTDRAAMYLLGNSGPLWANGDTIEWTALMAEAIPATDNPGGPYFSGASPKGLTPYTVSWVGTVGASPSVANYQTPNAARRDAITALLRVLNRERYVLEVRPDGVTESRWINCYRSADPDLTAKLMGRAWAELDVTIPADPFAYGPKESLGSLAFTIAGDFKVAVPASQVKGDVPTPLVIDYNTTLNGSTMFVSSAPGDATSLKCIADLPVYTSGGSGGTTVTDDTTAGGYGGGDSGIGGHRAKVTGFTASNWADPIANTNGVNLLTDAAGTSAPPPGLYRAYLLHDSNLTGASDTYVQFELTAGASGGYGFLGSTPVIVPNAQGVTDLGLVELPIGGRPLQGGFDAAAAADAVAMNLRVKVPTIGSGAAPQRRLDAIVWMPASYAHMVLQHRYIAGGTSPRRIVVDPITGLVGAFSAATGKALSDQILGEFVGQPPVVSPTEDSMLYAFEASGYSFTDTVQNVDLNGVATTYAPVTFSAYYWPRYLTVL